MNVQRTTIALLIAIRLSVSLSGFATADDDHKPHAVIVVGTLHYSPELTMPVFARELERFGFRTTVVMGEGDPEKKTENVVPGIEALADADLAIFFMRFLKLPDSEWLCHKSADTGGAAPKRKWIKTSTTIRQTRTGWTSICKICRRQAKRRHVALAILCLWTRPVAISVSNPAVLPWPWGSSRWTLRKWV